MNKGFFGLINRLFLYVEKLLNDIFSPKYNPFYFLGAITIFFLWLLLISGIYLFIFYKMSPQKAYESVQYLTVDQWYLGGIMRSIHRYASDGIMISMTLHTLQVFFKDKYRRQRWLAWVSGVALVAFILFEGLSGYWLVWDQLAQMVAIFVAELLDLLPIFGEPLTRAFISNTSVTGLFFFLMLGMHIAVPIFGLILILVHIARISRAKINPPWLLNIAMVVAFLLLSIVKPAVSGPPADFTKIPTSLGVDWFYLFYLPMLKVLPPWKSWILTIGFFLLFTIIPWLTRKEKPPIARVSLKECTGCAQCFEDCPYEAIVMKERKEDIVCPYCGSAREKEAVILEDKCISCGICIGSCDYRAMSLGEISYEQMKKEIEEAIEGIKDREQPILGFVCRKSVDLDRLLEHRTGTLKEKPNVRIISLLCSGDINPNILAYALRKGARGVFVCGCPVNDCHYRLGNTWLEKRIRGERKPKLKVDVDSRLRVYWLSAIQSDELLREIDKFEEELRKGEGRELFIERQLRWVFALPAAVVLLIPTLLIFYLSDASYSFYSPEMSQLKVSFKHTTHQIQDCNESEMIQKEIEKYKDILKKTHRVPMRQIMSKCSRERFPLLVEVYVDGKRLLKGRYKPRGLKKDGPAYIYSRFPAISGRRKIEVRLVDSGREEGYDYIFKKEIDLRPGEVILIGFSDSENRLLLNGE